MASGASSVLSDVIAEKRPSGSAEAQRYEWMLSRWGMPIT